MSYKRLFQNLSITILMLVVAACGEAPYAAFTLAPDLLKAAFRTSDLHPTPTPTRIPSPSQPPIPSPQTDAGLEIIEPGNAGQLMELARLGKGTILSAPIWAPDGMQIYSPDGMWMAIPTSVGIYIYDAAALEELRRIPVGTAFITFSPDGSLLAVSERDAVSLWNPATAIQTGKLVGNPDDVYSELSFSPDGSLLAAITRNREVSVWSVASGEPLFTFPGGRLRFSPDGELAVAVVYGENRVHLYETRGGTEVNKWNVRNAGFTPGGLLWLEDNATVRLVYIDRDMMTAPFHGVKPSFSADGTLMALFANGQISLYEHQQGRRVQMLEGSYVQIDGVLFSPDGQTLAGDVYTLHCPTCTEMDGLDRSLVLWRVTNGTVIAKIEHQDRAGWMGYSADGSLLAVVQAECAQIIKAADGSIVARIDDFTTPIVGMTLSPDGKTVAAAHATDPYTLRLWDLETGQVTRTHQSQQAPNQSNVEAAYSPDGKYVAVGGDLWDLATGRQLNGVEQAIGEKTSCWPISVSFAPEENVLATGCFEGQLDLWSIPDGELLVSIDGYDSWVEDLAYSPDGEYLAVAYGVPDYLVQVWQLPEGEPSFILTGGHFMQVTYSADGRTLATVVTNEEYDPYGWPAGFVYLRGASDGKELGQLDLEDAVCIAYSPDGWILATGSLDGTLRLWEVPEGRLLMEIRGHNAQVQHLVFTPDGTRLVTGSQDGTIVLWGVPDPFTVKPTGW